MWFKLDDGFHSSRKLLSIPKRHRFASAGLWSVAGSWCGHNLTDGHVPAYMIEEWAPPPHAVKCLVEAGFWDEVPTGYQFRNWLEYQPSKAEVEKDRARNRQRQKEWRERNKKGSSDGLAPDSMETRPELD